MIDMGFAYDYSLVIETTPPILPSPTLHDCFYHPLTLALNRAMQTRPYQSCCGRHYLSSDMDRIIESFRSGREWVHELHSALMTTGQRSWNRLDSRNSGALSDELVGPSSRANLQRIRYQNPELPGATLWKACGLL